MIARDRHPHLAMLIVAALSVAALIVLAFFDPKRAAAGWLVGFLFWSQIPVGSLLLSLIFILTGGRWGRILQPVLVPATAAVPWLFIAVIPVLIAVPVLYPWVAPNGAVKPDVVADYLNVPFFVSRSLIALAVWSVFSVLIRRVSERRAGLVAGIGLLLYGLTISSVAIDWFLSLEPPFVSSSFGASVGIMQLIAATAWSVLLAPGATDDSAVGDIGALLLAFVLGITYVDFMALLVIWYGDLPGEVSWFAERIHSPWSIIAGASFVLGSVAPIFALFLSRVRSSRLALRMVAASVLLGSALYIAYLIAPPFGAGSLIPAAVALVAIGLIQFTVMTAIPTAMPHAEATAHGR